MAGKFVGAALLAAGLMVGATQIAVAQEEKVLNIYNWSDYIAEDTVKNFEKETGIKVRYDLFDNNEILNSKLVAGKSGYDIVVPTAQWARLQIDGKLLRKLDKSKLPNLKNLDPAIQTKLAAIDPGNDYLVDWMWGYTTVGINVNKVKAALGGMPMPDNAWELIFNPKYASKLKSCGVSFLDSPSEVLPPALIYAGKPAFSKNAADYAEAGKVLQAIRPYVTLFSSSGYINDLANGGICVALGWSGDINIARQRAIDAKNGNVIEALVPKTSAALVFDTMAIPADAPHPNNAHLWINYIMRPEVHASLTNKVFYANPNAASVKFVRKDIASNKSVFLSEEDKKRMTPPEAVPADIRRNITRIYTKFKTGV
ncbi:MULTISPECIES: polyamine ABC transporter substrate-binding protein [unclassified Duganella]|uniref:polyamine ABC transporter substrate-binding protein n=1 Tax=unclassified Duganella TaxID=2636909 RepID=UPI0008802B4F|nr:MULTISPECIES: polyamine ABC transporter substrate-binding protein [unclassified Duganella]SDG37972.1 putrescine transport system substrate-binding protein [Duganella sp. OV458]SDJ65719.1 putrescine transport system substrate-binding protein [Duganella sp. OV510]